MGPAREHWTALEMEAAWRRLAWGKGGRRKRRVRREAPGGGREALDVEAVARAWGRRGEATIYVGVEEREAKVNV